MALRFRHLRRFNELGEVLSTGGLTVAYLYEDDPHGTGKGNSTVEIATAVCSNRDVYSRKAGRDISASLFDSGHTALLPVFNRDIEHTFSVLEKLLMPPSGDLPMFNAQCKSLLKD